LRTERRRFSDLGEFGLIRRFTGLVVSRDDVEVGVGDDCAVVRVGEQRLLLTTDALVEGVHFRRSWDRPAGLGRRAFAVNASDIAAMGGRPRYALLSLAAPKSAASNDLTAMVRGFVAAAAAKGCVLVGGNLASAPRWMVSVTLIGEPCGKPLLRSGARVGDLVYVSGTLGGAAYAREILLGYRIGTRSETLPFRRPVARLTLGAALAREGMASAAIDVSDGLLQDLGHVCEASGVGAVVDPSRIPYARCLRRLSAEKRQTLAMAGGEDYELVFTVPQAHAERLARARVETRIACIGSIVRGSNVRVVGANGTAARPMRGFDHFRR
jgi:thiamine-monophosphate kinase